MLTKNCPIEEFAAELRRRSAESMGNAQANSKDISSISQRDEAIIAEKIAREQELWIEFSEVINLGTPFPSGMENDVYLNSNGNIIYKVNNLMTSKTMTALFERLLLHNSIFPQTEYRFRGVTGFGNGSAYPVLSQNYIPNEREATPIEIDTYMAALGFEKTAVATFTRDNIIVSDLHPRNVLRDSDGDIYVVDAEFKVKESF